MVIGLEAQLKPDVSLVYMLYVNMFNFILTPLSILTGPAAVLQQLSSADCQQAAPVKVCLQVLPVEA